MKYLNKSMIDRCKLLSLNVNHVNPFNNSKRAPFIVTGMPRSGTMFISQILNKSSDFFVSHDLHVNLGHQYSKTKNIEYIKKLNKRIAINGYGDVSCVHRSYLTDLDIDKKVIIVRNPIKVLESYLNMGEANVEQTIKRLKNGLFVKDFYRLMDYIDKEGLPFFKFEDLTTDVNTWNRLFKILEIEDVSLSLEDINQKINSRPKDNRLQDLDVDIVNNFIKSIKIYRERSNYMNN